MATGASRRMSFDRNAITYRVGRPPYPQRLYEILEDRYGLGPGCRVLEIGPGSGTATAELLARGAHVTAVEPGDAFVDMLRASHASQQLTVVHSALEHAELTPAGFDLAVAATSWHWLDPAVAVPKVGPALTENAGLAVWWTVFGDPDVPVSRFRAGLDRLYAQWLPGEPDDGRPPLPLRTSQWSQQISAGAWFDQPQIETIRWVQPMTPDAARALWSTFPNIAELPLLDREAFLAGVAGIVDDLGGVVDDSRVTVLYHTRRRSPQ